ncbi:Protoporphyrinogen oxidase [Rhodospirillales bacterium URHD0017]|nr:Protoporphyrinogen oxidase [Rhodospirillales bacterium URHD0017]
MARVAVVGAGAMGLAAAYHALKLGHQVTVFEGDRVAGGMAAHFDFDGLSIERFYHFICKADRATFDLMAELGISDKLIWRDTSMGYYVDGRHYRWGDPLALLAFPKLGLLDKLRYGLHMFLSTRRRDWSALEHVNARDWFVKWHGRRAYEVLWRRLFDLKFFEYADDISAAWIWTRIKRVGTSRRSVFQEQLGCIDGGSEVLIEALVGAVEGRGGKVRLGARVSQITSEAGRVTGLVVDGERLAFDAVISTVPTPFVSALVPGLSDAAKARYDAIRNIGVVCVLLKLAKPVTQHFWLNVNDAGIDIPGIVEFSNLRKLPDTVVYVPYYMPQTHPKFTRSNEAFVAEAYGYLRKLNPALQPQDLKASQVGRLRYAQPVCPPGFLAKLPKVQTEIAGLQIADTCFYYPEDRGISESVRYGQLMARAVTEPAVWEAEGR